MEPFINESGKWVLFPCNFEHRPPMVEAVWWKDEWDVPKIGALVAWCGGVFEMGSDQRPCIRVFGEDRRVAYPGDWIIRHPNGGCEAVSDFKMRKLYRVTECGL